jgi:hypothetical protein
MCPADSSRGMLAIARSWDRAQTCAADRRRPTDGRSFRHGRQRTSAITMATALIAAMWSTFCNSREPRRKQSRPLSFEGKLSSSLASDQCFGKIAPHGSGRSFASRWIRSLAFSKRSSALVLSACELGFWSPTSWETKRTAVVWSLSFYDRNSNRPPKSRSRLNRRRRCDARVHRTMQIVHSFRAWDGPGRAAPVFVQ